jgi:cysteine desulfurase
MGYPTQAALGAIRLTLGRDTTAADVDWAAMVLKQVLERLMPQEKILTLSSLTPHL